MILPGFLTFLKVLVFLISSWFLIHFFAVFGVFVAFAYPVWWLLDFKRLPCLWCRIKKSYQCSFTHSLYDGLLILLFTLISFGLVFVEGKILFKMGFPPTPKTVSFVIPTKGQYRLEEIFPMKIEITGVKVPVNAVQADLSFDPSKLEVMEVSTQDSFANIFIQKEINNVVGYIRLTGGLPNPGYFSDHGIFGDIFFKGISSGIAKVEFLPSSMVLANDGRGTNVLKELASVFYLILPEKISKEEEEMQKEIILKPVVLGTEIQETQMKFYEEEKVLGVQVGQEIEKEKKFNLGKILLDFLERADRAILTLWGKIFFK